MARQGAAVRKKRKRTGHVASAAGGWAPANKRQVKTMTRQEFMLAVLAAGNGEAHTPVQVQKLFFLLDKSVPEQIEGPRFDFQPYDYGPFDKAVYEELRALATEGLVTISSLPNGSPTYWATPEGLSRGQELLKQFPAATTDYIRQLSAWVREQSFAALVSGQGERIKFSHGAGVKCEQSLRQPLFLGLRHA
jgi:hypothetical protein